MAARRKKTELPRNRQAPRTSSELTDGGATVGSELCQRVRSAGFFTAGDQLAPCIILWTDPERLWEGVLTELKPLLPELFAFGAYAPEERAGPAVWLRCVESRAIKISITNNQIPIFYLPGVSKQQLREVEECPTELQPLVELQFRGTIWVHPNGKDWTPYAFLSSERGGLGLDVARDSASDEALLRALRQVLKEKLADLQGQRLDADFFNGLLTPDLPSVLLRWMNNPKEAKAAKTRDEWSAFCDQCSAAFKFHPGKDGELRAAVLLGGRKDNWAIVWKRFSEAPHRYPGVVILLEWADPSSRGELPFEPEPWPKINDREEDELRESLKGFYQLRRDEVIPRVRELEAKYGRRRDWVWRELGRSQLAVALEHLDRLATLAEKPLAAASANELGDLYMTSGWEVDAAAIAALACCKRIEDEKPISAAVRVLYTPWLDESARNLQDLAKASPDALRPRLGRVNATEGSVIIFVDGLRIDVGQMLADQLRAENLQLEMTWDWAPFPSVTATAKPYVSPVANLFRGGEAGDEFAVTIAATGQRWTQERFEMLLAENGVEVLKGTSLGGGKGKGWTEVGELDKRGHDLDWKLARIIDQEVKDLAARVRGFLSAGWKEVLLVTDHGWLLLPGGFPKIELPKFLVEHRWGRCAAMKEGAATNLPVIPWHWNPAVSIASPPGVGCFKAGKEYVHGGISPQELVVPRITVRPPAVEAVQSRIAGIKWVGLRCRVTVEEPAPGLRVDLRSRPAEAGSSKVESGEAREVGPDGTASLPVADDSEEGSAAVVVLVAADGRVIQYLPTVIGGSA